MTNYTWTISSLETAPQEGQLIDVVKIVHWRYKGVDGDYSAEVYSSYACAEPSSLYASPYKKLMTAPLPLFTAPTTSSFPPVVVPYI